MTAIDAHYSGEPDEMSGPIERLAGSFEKRSILQADRAGRPKGRPRRIGPVRSSGSSVVPIAVELLELTGPLEGGPGGWRVHFKDLKFDEAAVYMLFFNGVKLFSDACLFSAGVSGLLVATFLGEVSPSAGEADWAEVWAFNRR